MYVVPVDENDKPIGERVLVPGDNYVGDEVVVTPPSIPGYTPKDNNPKKHTVTPDNPNIIKIPYIGDERPVKIQPVDKETGKPIGDPVDVPGGKVGEDIEITPPDVPGYTPEKDKVPHKITPDNPNIVEVPYIPQDRDVYIRPVDSKTNQPIGDDIKVTTGKVGKSVTVTPPGMDGYKPVDPNPKNHTITPDKPNIIEVPYDKDDTTTITIKKVSEDGRIMPCVKYAVYKAETYETDKLSAFVGFTTTDENGIATIEVKKGKYRIEEVGLVPDCNKCVEDGKNIPCTKEFGNYRPNKEVPEVPEGDNPEVTFEGFKSKIKIPMTGTLGKAPYIALGLIVLIIIAVIAMRDKKKKEF